MATSTGVLTDQIRPEVNNNLLTRFCNFNDIPFNWNSVSGDTNSTVETTALKPFYGKGSMQITFTGTGEHVFNCGGDEMTFTIAQTRTHIFAYRLYCDNPSATVEFAIEILKDGILLDGYEVVQTLTTANGFTFNQWNTYFIDLPYTAGEEITFNFKATSDNFSGTKLFVDGLDFKAQDKGAGYPMLYSEVEPTQVIQTETIDLPSIAHNDTYTGAITIIGVEVGDFVEVVPPVALVTNQLICSAYATDTNEITLAVHNSSGGAVDLGSSSFKFKATRY